MQTDPSRVKKTDAGDPEKCSVWNLHKIFTENDTQNNIQKIADQQASVVLIVKKF